MSAVKEFDVGPLTWVKGEIDQALEHARSTLAQFAGNPAEGAPLKFCLTHLHQVAGALQMVGLDGLARFAEELESTLSALDKQEFSPTAERLALFNRALAALTRYLEELMNGEANVPLRLFPLYQELFLVRGSPPATETDLFFPDLGAQPPKLTGATSPAAGELALFVKTHRSAFQRGLLRWLRDSEDAAAKQIMLDALRAIEGTQPLPAQRSFWWSAVGLIDAIGQQSVEPDFEIKRLCARIDLQLRRLASGSPKVAERLLRDVLYSIARSKPAKGRVAEIKKLYQLERHLPAASAATIVEIDLVKLRPILRDLRDILTQAKDAWVKFTSGNRAFLSQFAEALSKLKQKSGELNDAQLVRLLDVMQPIALGMTSTSEARRDELGIEIATALLVAENALDNMTNRKADIMQQVGVMVGRLRAVAGGKARDDDESSQPVLDEISRRAQEKLLIAQVVREIQSNLQHIEQVLDGFFRNPGKREGLPGLTPFLSQIAGALNILRLDEAVELLKACQALITRAGSADYQVVQSELELLAEGLSSLGFYIEAIEHDQPEPVKIIAPVLSRLTGKESSSAGEDLAQQTEKREREESAPQSISVESDLAQHKQHTQALFEAWQQQPQDAVAKEELQNQLEAIRQDADLIADKGLHEQTAAALDLLSSADTEKASLAQAISQITAPKVAAVIPSEQAARMLVASSDAIDAELFEIYLEEAAEVLATVAEHLTTCRAQPQQREALTTIRRGFHTLKGSGRMVGLMQLGEVAWSIEQVLNEWLQQDQMPTPALFDLIALAHDSFAEWVAKLKNEGSVEIQAQPVHDLAAQLRHSAEPTAVAAGAAVDTPGQAKPLAALAATAFAERVETITKLQVHVEIADPAPAAEPATNGSSATVSEVAPSQDDIRIGDTVVPAELYDIFMKEAEQHLGTLERESASLHGHPEQPIEHEFMRAAHTLAGIARTTGVTAVVELALALELYLQELMQHPARQNAAQIASIEGGVGALRNMVHALNERRTPEGVEPALQALRDHLLEARARHKPAESTEAVAGSGVADALEINETDAARGLEAWSPVEADEPLEIEATGGVTADIELEALPSFANRPPAFEIELPTLDQPQLDRAADEASVEDVVVGEAPTASAPLTMLEAIPAEHVAEAPVTGPTAAPPALEVTLHTQPSDELAIEPQPPKAERAGEPAAPAVERRVVRDDIDEQLLPIFLEEAAELVPQIGDELRLWKNAPSNTQAPLALRRALHTLKGGARMAGAMRLGELTHNMESRVDVALETSALTAELFEILESEFDRVNDAVERLQRGDFLAAGGTPAETPAQVPLAKAAAIAIAAPEADLASSKALLRVRADVVDRLVNEAGEVSIARSRIDGEVRLFKQALIELTDSVTRLRGQLREVEIQAESQLQSRLSLLKEDDEAFDPLEFDRFTRFQELTRLMAESLHDVTTVQQTLLKNIDEADAALLQQARMNRDLQQELMRIRTVPFASTSERLYRIMRLTAKDLGKKANLEINGGGVELDRSVLEKIGAPLEHMLRNAIAHGLEDAAIRVASGKPEIGEITIDVRQQANEIFIALSDDGMGLDIERIRAKAEFSGLLPQGAEASDAQLMEFIFMPGFSTAEEITQTSGRGIGMEVARNEVTALGGRVEVASQRGKGTTFSIYLPLTLAVTQTVLIRVGARIYAVPSAMIEQVQELKAPALAVAHRDNRIEWQGNHYPFYYLPRLLGDVDQLPEAMRYSPILLLKSGAQRVAVQVDGLIGNQEIVVKNIGPQLARVAGIAGATVLGNGTVVLIINPVQLAQRETLYVAPIRQPAEPVAAVEPVFAAAPVIMVVDDSLTVRKITGRLLAREGYQVVTAKDGVDALKQLQDLTPDVMLVDIEMPRMDGFDLTKNVRADPITTHIPIIMITSRTADKHRSHAKQLGVNVFLGKPFQEEELLQHVASFVKSRTAVAGAEVASLAQAG